MQGGEHQTIEMFASAIFLGMVPRVMHLSNSCTVICNVGFVSAFESTVMMSKWCAIPAFSTFRVKLFDRLHKSRTPILFPVLNQSFKSVFAPVNSAERSVNVVGA